MSTTFRRFSCSVIAVLIQFLLFAAILRSLSAEDPDASPTGAPPKIYLTPTALTIDGVQFMRSTEYFNAVPITCTMFPLHSGRRYCRWSGSWCVEMRKQEWMSACARLRVKDIQKPHCANTLGDYVVLPAYKRPIPKQKSLSEEIVR